MGELLTLGMLFILLFYVFLTILSIGFILMGWLAKMKRMLKAGLILLTFVIVSQAFFLIRFYNNHKSEIAMRRIPGSYEAYKLDSGESNEDSLMKIKLVVLKNGEMEISRNTITQFYGKVHWSYNEVYEDCELNIYYETKSICSPVSFLSMGNELLINTSKSGSKNYLHFRKVK